MNLDSLSPSEGSNKKRKRVGRGIGSGLGKTCGRGHKGLKSRSGGKVSPGFEGGQQPLQRRLPKIGCTSRKSAKTAKIPLSSLSCYGASEEVNLTTLKKHGVIKSNMRFVKVFLSGEIKKSITLKGLRVTKGARAAIEAAGGKIEE